MIDKQKIKLSQKTDFINKNHFWPKFWGIAQKLFVYKSPEKSLFFCCITVSSLLNFFSVELYVYLINFV